MRVWSILLSAPAEPRRFSSWGVLVLVVESRGASLEAERRSSWPGPGLLLGVLESCVAGGCVVGRGGAYTPDIVVVVWLWGLFLVLGAFRGL